MRKCKKKYDKKYYARTAFSDNSWAKWSDEEIKLILERPVNDTELAYMLGRSVMSIQCKRALLKKQKQLVTD